MSGSTIQVGTVGQRQARVAWTLVLALVVAFTLVTPVQMAPLVIVASDQADAAAYNDDWQSGDNGGTGFSAWALSTTSGNGGQNGHFIGNATTNGDGDGNGDGDINSGGEAFALYANSGQTASAVRSFPLALGTSDIFRIQMDNGFLDNSGTVGVGLQNSAGNNLVEFFFVGGQSSYTVQDSSGSVATGVGFTDEGLNLVLTKTAGAGYSLAITPLGGSTTTINGTLANPAGGQGIAQVRLFNFNAGAGDARNAFFNRLIVEDNQPTAVTLASFAATDAETHVQVAWETAIETNNLGFNLLRATSAEGEPTRLNTALIPAVATGGGGAAYEWNDTSAEANHTYFYWLESVASDGTTTLAGPTSVTFQPATAVTLGALSAASPSSPVWALGLLVLAGLVALAVRRRRAV